jgi:hypothetical protein
MQKINTVLTTSTSKKWYEIMFYWSLLCLVVIIGLEFLLARFPIRLFHFLYTIIFGWIYCLGTYIIYRTSGRDEVYSFLNWKDGHGSFMFGTLETISLFTFGAITVIHMILFGISKFKFFIERKCIRDQGSFMEIWS